MAEAINPKPIRIAALNAAPLVWRGEDGQLHEIERLNFEAERALIFNSLGESGREIEIRIEAATTDNLRTLVSLGCRLLHFSGHGMPDFLAFEDGCGGTQELDPGTLKQLFAAGGTSGVQCVFVSACHSRQSGEAFVKAGVPHVVAVRLEEPVYDSAAINFARAFYLALATGKTVEQSFDIGRAAVVAMPHLPDSTCEAEKFLLLPEYGNHDASIFANVPSGKWRDATPPLPPHRLPAMPDRFIGRNSDWQTVVAEVAHERLVTIRGGPGIGKTALATAVGHYLNERRFFKDGVFFISLRGAESADTARAAIANALGVEAQNTGELCDAIREHRCLLVLDNCEDLLNQHKSELRSFIGQLLGQTYRVKLLLTSREALGGGLQGVTEKVHPLRHLSPRAAASLFLRRTPRNLTVVEARSPEFAEVLKFLAGHPQAIALAAALLQDKSLNQLYELLAVEKDRALQVPGLNEDERDAVNSLTISLNVSVNYLHERNSEAVRLFAVMGFLPSGALPEDLSAIWGDGWHPLMDALVRASLVERAQLATTEHFSTFPFVTTYAERLLTDIDRAQFAIRACEYFGQMSEAIYYALRTKQAAAAYVHLGLEELNLRACLEPKRPARPKREKEDVSPTGMVATYLPDLLLSTYRVDDGILMAKLGRHACRNVSDWLGEANTLKTLGNLKVRKDKLSEARGDFEAALSLYREIQYRLGEANTLRALGDLKARIEEFEEAYADYEAALPLYREVSDHLGEANTLLVLGDLSLRKADLVGARTFYEAALSIYREIHDLHGEANYRQKIGHLYLVESKPAEASAELHIALQIHEGIDDQIGIGSDLSYLAQAANLVGDNAQAIQLLENSVCIFRRISYRWGEALSLQAQGLAFFALGDLVGTLAAIWQARELWMAIGDSRAVILDALFEQLSGGKEENMQQLISALIIDAEGIRQEAIGRVKTTQGKSGDAAKEKPKESER